MNNENPCEKHDHTSERRDKTFPAFRDNTDEKNQTVRVTKEFLDGYLPDLIHNLSITVQDWGVGDGDLSGKIALLMQNYTNNSNSSIKEIKYEGIDRSIQFVENTTNNLFALGIKNNHITLGNIFGGGIDNLSKNPTLLIASQVIYYTKDISKFVENITKQMGFVAIIIGQATGSFLDHTGMEYDNTTNKTTGADVQLDTAVKEQVNFNSIKIVYNSIIDFPKNIPFEELKDIALSDYNELKGQRAHIRNLLEFSGGSMERLICEKSLERFLQDFQTQLDISEGNINFWNFISIIVPKDKVSAEELTTKLRKIEKLLLSGNVTSFESAIKEGNYEIIYTLFNQGLVTCRLNNYKYNFQKDATDRIISFLLYELRLAHGYQSLANLFNYELDPHADFRNYTHPAIHRMKSIKYNFNIPTDIADKLKKEPSLVISPGDKYNKQFDWWWLHNEYFCSALLIIPFLIIGDRSTIALLSLSMALMYQNQYEKFIFTSTNAVNTMNGEELLIQLFLFEENNIDSLKFQNSMGQTPLHLAISTNDTDKAFKLLCCSSTLVDNLVNIKDIHGKLPIHYAGEYNNIKIAEIILNNEASLDIESYNYLRSFFNLLFLSGKLGYLYAFFTDWVQTNRLHPAMMLWPTYYILKDNNVRFPENIYFHSFLLRLNPFGQEGNYLNKSSESYDGYSRDSFFHLASKNNHTDFVKSFVNKSSVNINKYNAYGKSTLHLAAENNNLELMSFLIDNQADVNNRGNTWSIYPYADFTLKSVLLYLSTNSVWRVLSDALFLNSVYEEMFSAFPKLNGGTPLHSAAHSNHTSKEALELLIQNGADPDLTMTVYDSYKIQIIPYVVTKSILLIANCFYPRIDIRYKISLLGAIQVLVPYTVDNLRPINLVNNIASEKKYIIDQCVEDDVFGQDIIEAKEQCIVDPYGDNNSESSPSEEDNLLNLNKNIDEFDILESILYRVGHPPLNSEDKKKSELYQYLKQYTVLQDYKSIEKFNIIDSMLYKLGLISDEDTIHIKEPGAYKGGSGKDTFIIYSDEFTGDIIIKDYTPEDQIICADCDKETFEFRSESVLNSESAIISINNKIELILLGTDVNDVNFS